MDLSFCQLLGYFSITSVLDCPDLHTYQWAFEEDTESFL